MTGHFFLIDDFYFSAKERNVAAFTMSHLSLSNSIVMLYQELHDSLPSDPAEADLLKMAEAVADATDDADCASSSAKKGSCHIEKKHFLLVLCTLSFEGAYVTRVPTNLEKLELSGNFVHLEKSGNLRYGQGIFL